MGGIELARASYCRADLVGKVIRSRQPGNWHCSGESPAILLASRAVILSDQILKTNMIPHAHPPHLQPRQTRLDWVRGLVGFDLLKRVSQREACLKDI
jgi:hypothetical protein